MAGNQEICNDHDNIITDAVTYNSGTSADGDRNHDLISNSHISDGLHDGHFMPLLPLHASSDVPLVVVEMEDISDNTFNTDFLSER